MQKPFCFTKSWEYSFYVFPLGATEQPLTIYSTTFILLKTSSQSQISPSATENVTVILYCLKDSSFNSQNTVEKQTIPQQRTQRTIIPTEKLQNNNQMYLQRKCGIRSFPQRAYVTRTFKGMKHWYYISISLLVYPPTVQFDLES